MGRSLSWYVVPRDCVHEDTKKFCFGWEFQEDEDVIRDQVVERIKGPYCEWGVKGPPYDVDYFKRKTNENAEKSYMLCQYLYDIDDKHQDFWCSKCKLFAAGFYNSPIVMAHHKVSHSYSNPIWQSRWNVKDLYLGNHTAYARLFRDENNYREIDMDDVEKAYEFIADLGEPLRKSDIEARDETMKVLTFCKEWTQKEGVRVIIDDEI